MLLVKPFHWGAFLKELEYNESKLLESSVTIKAQLSWHTIESIMPDLNILNYNIILSERKLSLKKLNSFIVTQVKMLLMCLLILLEGFILRILGRNYVFLKIIFCIKGGGLMQKYLHVFSIFVCSCSNYSYAGGSNPHLLDLD